MGLQHQLDAKVKELESLLNSELHSQLGVNQNLASRLKTEEIAALKVRFFLFSFFIHPINLVR
jgi:alpha-D-ribose 1-methylphosphonate 5-triphosphate synthase subunit PhnG